MLRTLLVPLDLSPGSERVVERAALLPLADDARVVLLHVVPRMLRQAARAHAEEDAHKKLRSLVKRVARSFPKQAVLEPVVRVGGAAAEISRHAQSIKAELTVMGRGHGRLRDFAIGSTAERVVRQARRPVLVVRLPARARYRRPLVALDLDKAAGDVVAMVLRVVPAPRPRLAWVHAYDAPFHAAVYPSLAREEDALVVHYRQKARKEIAQLLQATERVFWQAHLRHGSARTVIRKTAAKITADLVALGTHGHAGIAYAFLGTVAGDVLREVPCDVLVVPPR